MKSYKFIDVGEAKKGMTAIDEYILSALAQGIQPSSEAKGYADNDSIGNIIDAIERSKELQSEFPANSPEIGAIRREIEGKTGKKYKRPTWIEIPVDKGSENPIEWQTVKPPKVVIPSVPPVKIPSKRDRIPLPLPLPSGGYIPTESPGGRYIPTKLSMKHGNLKNRDVREMLKYITGDYSTP